MVMPFFLRRLSELLCILLRLVEVERVNDLSLIDILQTPLLSFLLDMVGVANKNDVGDIVGKHMIESLLSMCALPQPQEERCGCLLALARATISFNKLIVCY